MRRLLKLPRWVLGYDGVPYMARSTFRWDFLSTLLASVASGALVLEFTQLFALNTLGAPVWISAVLVAETTIGNLFSAFFSQRLQRGRRVPFLVSARLAMALVLAAIAMLPASHASVWPFAGLLLIPAMAGTIFLNAQSGLWHANYPESCRGRIISRLSICRLIAAMLSVKLIGYAMDHCAWGHHLVYAVAAAFMLASAVAIGRIRVRQERAALRHANSEPIHLLRGFLVLRKDRPFAQYMLWQMVSGISVLMASPVIVPAMKKAFDIDYSQGASSLVLTPYLVEMLTVPLSGWLYDKIDIMRFRALNALFWATSRLSLLLGLLFHNWPLVLTGFAIQGLGCSTGGVVWSIGHMRFARVEESQLYMGVHLSLQGLRGLTMPFLGMWLYSIPWINLHVMTIAVVIQFVAVCEFFLLREQPPSAEGK